MDLSFSFGLSLRAQGKIGPVITFLPIKTPSTAGPHWRWKDMVLIVKV